jgi:hypothetical protein
LTNTSLDLLAIALRLGVRLPLLGARARADDEVEAAAGNLVDVRRVEERVERLLSKQIAADESGVPDERG